jgi:hypothetical protein
MRILAKYQRMHAVLNLCDMVHLSSVVMHKPDGSLYAFVRLAICAFEGKIRSEARRGLNGRP